MDPQLLKYYERELQFIREMGAEYAEEYPKIASRLAIDGVETADPFVERLYEGFAFLAARIQMRIEAEYPKFTESLFNTVYPQYLAPTPSATIVKMHPSPNASLEEGAKVPRGTSLKSIRMEGQQTACEFKTAHDVTLWPIEIKEAEYMTNMAAFSGVGTLRDVRPKAGLRLRISTTTGSPLNETLFDRLDLYLAGHSGQAMRIYEQIFSNATSVVLCPTSSDLDWMESLESDAIKQVGFSDKDALFPFDPRSFSGYRLLREYFTLTERFMFFRIDGLGRGIELCQDSELDVVILFDQIDTELENRVTPKDFELFCTPAINLFPKRADRIHVSQSEEEYHVVVDRTQAMDFEVFEITGVNGYETGLEKKQSFLPFYGSNDLIDHPSFYNVRRERRQLSASQKRLGPRTNYVGSESFISLVDPSEAPFSSKIKQLEVKALCTNRDLPIQMQIGKGVTDFSLEVSAPVDSIRCIRAPSRPRPSLAHQQGEIAWRLINQLSSNYLSLVNSDAEESASVLRDLLMLYVDSNDAVLKKQVGGLQTISSEQVTRRLPMPGPIAFGRGLRISLTFDETAFVGSGIFLLGSILDRFLARYVTINSFVETVICGSERGVVHSWPARIGRKSIV